MRLTVCDLAKNTCDSHHTPCACYPAKETVECVKRTNLEIKKTVGCMKRTNLEIKRPSDGDMVRFTHPTTTGRETWERDAPRFGPAP